MEFLDNVDYQLQKNPYFKELVGLESANEIVGEYRAVSHLVEKPKLVVRSPLTMVSLVEEEK